jgi:hypothetical protein
MKCNRPNNNAHRVEVYIIAALAIIAVLCVYYLPKEC